MYLLLGGKTECTFGVRNSSKYVVSGPNCGIEPPYLVTCYISTAVWFSVNAVVGKGGEI